MANRDDFHIDMGIRFTPDEHSVDEIDKLFDSFKKVSIVADTDDSLRKTFDDFIKRRQSLIEAEKMLTQYQQAHGTKDEPVVDDDVTKELQKYIEELIGSNAALAEEFGDYIKKDKNGDPLDLDIAVLMGNLKTQLLDKLEDLASSFLKGIGNVFKSAWEEMDTMLNSSLLTNSNTRENAFTYGFSASESYGFDKAKEMLGIQNDEDLMYMNDNQKDKFSEVMTKYAEKYDALYDKGFFDDYQDFQIEMDEFMLDIKMELIEFFMNNKDTIKTFLHLVMDGMQFIVTALSWLMDFFGGSQQTADETKTANINEIISSYTTNNSPSITQNNNTTINGTTASQAEKLVDTLSSGLVEAMRGLGG